jgi:hypothetical protein
VQESTIGSFGGWAVDFAVGDMTRQHRDVDFVIWEVDLPRITELLRFLGYRVRSSKHPNHQLNWEKSGTEVQINLITKTDRRRCHFSWDL